MQFSTVAALTALAATVSAWGNGTAVVYTTEVFTAYTTFCPASTELTYNGVTYTATESTTLTITNCPCTIVKPVTTSSVVAPTSTASSAVVYPTGTPSYLNSTIAASSVPATSVAVGTTSAKSSATATPSTISSSGANKAFALSGASLAGVLGFAAYFL